MNFPLNNKKEKKEKKNKLDTKKFLVSHFSWFNTWNNNDVYEREREDDTVQGYEDTKKWWIGH